jgi:AraC-like DNA-binding protein
MLPSAPRAGFLQRAGRPRKMATSILLVRALVEGVEQRGTPRERFLAAAGYEAERLDDGDARISVEEHDRLVEIAIDVTGDNALGLHMGEIANATTYSLVAHLIAYAATMRQAIDSYLRYHRILTDQSVFRLTEQGQSATLRFDVAPSTLVCQRFHAEHTLAGLFRLVQYFGGGSGIHRVSFEHARPEHASEYARLFGGLERFEQPESGVTFDAALLDKAQFHADAEFYAALEEQARQRVSRLDERTPHKERVFQFLIECVTVERQDMNAAARALGVSVRTLRRRLHEEGASYSDIAKAALAARAQRLVADVGRTIDEAAYLLGFSERSAFHRAFKRWTGMTPMEYRRASPRGITGTPSHGHNLAPRGQSKNA